MNISIVKILLKSHKSLQVSKTRRNFVVDFASVAKSTGNTEHIERFTIDITMEVVQEPSFLREGE